MNEPILMHIGTRVYSPRASSNQLLG